MGPADTTQVIRLVTVMNYNKSTSVSTLNSKCLKGKFVRGCLCWLAGANVVLVLYFVVYSNQFYCFVFKITGSKTKILFLEVSLCTLVSAKMMTFWITI